MGIVGIAFRKHAACRRCLLATALLTIGAAAFLTTFDIPAAGAAVESGAAIPAPLSDPAVCGYFRLREGFERLVKDGADPDQVASTAANAPERVFFDAFEAAARARDQVRANARGESAKSSNMKRSRTGTETSRAMLGVIRAFSAARAFMPDDLFVFVRGPGEYAALVTGNVTPQAWENLFDASARMPRAAGFTVNAAGGDVGADRPILHVGPGYLLLAPAGLEGNLLDALQAGATLDDDKWKTFRKMVGLKPVAALEADMEGFLERRRDTGAEEALLPFPYDRIQVLRLLLDARVIKAQLYAPDEQARTLLRQAAGGIAQGIRAATAGSLFADAFGTIAESIQQTSVFIEGRGLDRNASLAGVSTLGVLAQLFRSALPGPVAQ
ncbi:MAG TPA: hypothetical protein PLU72_13565 [Candidatus Ozemobacteraceae bacterium]|nr:hypothetical protein [Candidatus Ozemobacteraceae bacterium]HQG29398.1 hypothetical protein [Candidatus Ozemobacteraceae bacterium]